MRAARIWVMAARLRTLPAAIAPRPGQRPAPFLQAGRHGDMEWMATTAERRRHPVSMWPETRSIVMHVPLPGFADNYPMYLDDDPSGSLAVREQYYQRFDRNPSYDLYGPGTIQ